MNESFASFPQTRFWYEVHDHLASLQGVVITSSADAHIVGSWIDFSFRGHAFSINATAGEFRFYVEGAECSRAILEGLVGHFESFF